jgi:transposase-like protein
LKRYRCDRSHGFSIDFRPKPRLLGSYLGGPSVRNIAAESGLKKSAIAERLKREFAALPKNESVTKEYCTSFGGVLCVDGVYLRVRGREMMPFISGIDFVTHDVPAGIIDFAESEIAFERLFRILRDIGYPLRYVVADEAPALKPALRKVFPQAEIQLCQVHVLRNVKRALHVTRRDETHLPFFRSVQELFRMAGEDNRRAFFLEHARSQSLKGGESEMLKSIRSRWDDLFRYESIRKEGLACPRDNNLSEAYNQHFQSRMANIKGFETISSAERFVNAWMLRRRFTPFRACGKHFKHLNGKTPFSQSRNPDLPYPDILL